MRLSSEWYWLILFAILSWQISYSLMFTRFVSKTSELIFSLNERLLKAYPFYLTILSQIPASGQKPTSLSFLMIESEGRRGSSPLPTSIRAPEGKVSYIFTIFACFILDSTEISPLDVEIH